MVSATRHLLAGCDGYRVIGADEVLGSVEELWLGAADEPVAAVVRLLDERRGLVGAEDVAAVVPAEESLTLASDARLIRLDPPYVEQPANGFSSATWRATGEVLSYPCNDMSARDSSTAPARGSPHLASGPSGKPSSPSISSSRQSSVQ
jgi:hypothetical protein